MYREVRPMDTETQEDGKRDLQKIHFADSDFRKGRSMLMKRIGVMVAHKDGAIAVRDSKDSSQNTLIFNKEEWEVFIKRVKGGEFDF
jgi:hypothetical protein